MDQWLEMRLPQAREWHVRLPEQPESEGVGLTLGLALESLSQRAPFALPARYSITRMVPAAAPSTWWRIRVEGAAPGNPGCDPY
jgi:hypothetical protein